MRACVLWRDLCKEKTRLSLLTSPTRVQAHHLNFGRRAGGDRLLGLNHHRRVQRGANNWDHGVRQREALRASSSVHLLWNRQAGIITCTNHIELGKHRIKKARHDTVQVNPGGVHAAHVQEVLREGNEQGAQANNKTRDWKTYRGIHGVLILNRARQPGESGDDASSLI